MTQLFIIYCQTTSTNQLIQIIIYVTNVHQSILSILLDQGSLLGRLVFLLIMISKPVNNYCKLTKLYDADDAKKEFQM